MSYSETIIEGGSIIRRDLDGAIVPQASDNRDFADYLAWLAAGNAARPIAPPPPTADDVRREASRRMVALLGARDVAHLEVIIANGSREAIRLLRKGSSNWTAEEAARAAGLEQIDQAMEAIRAASNALEAAPPADYASDIWWP